VEQEETWYVDWSSRISVLEPIFSSAYCWNNFCLVGTDDDNIKNDLTGKRKVGVSGRGVGHSICITDSENLNT